MKSESREQFIKTWARIIARAKEESKKQKTSLMSSLFGPGWQKKWRKG